MTALDSFFFAASPADLWEIRIMSEAAGDTVLDATVLTTKKVRINGIFGSTINERYKIMGWADDATAFVAVRKPIDHSSQVEYEDVKYEIVQEFQGCPYLNGKVYVYGLRRLEGVPV